MSESPIPPTWNKSTFWTEDSGLLCIPHELSVCPKCPFDYSLAEGFLAAEWAQHDDTMTEGESLLSESELVEYKAALVAMKGCDCHFPFMGEGCGNCNPSGEEEEETEQEDAREEDVDAEETNSGDTETEETKSEDDESEYSEE